MIRVAVVAAVVLVVNVWAEPLAQVLDLGSRRNVLPARALPALLLGRATLDFAYRALESFFRHVTVNLLSLVHGVLDLGLVALVVWTGTGYDRRHRRAGSVGRRDGNRRSDCSSYGTSARFRPVA